VGIDLERRIVRPSALGSSALDQAEMLEVIR